MSRKVLPKVLLAYGLAAGLFSVVVEAEATDASEPRTCSTTVSLDDFRAIAFKKSPLIAEIDAQYAGELAAAFEKEVLRNPELSVEQVWTHGEVGGADDPQSNIYLSQGLRLSNFGSRERVANLTRKAGDQQKRLRLLELNQKLKLQFYTLVSLQRAAEILGAAEDTAAKRVSAIREGVKKGLLSSGDEKLFEGEKYRLQAERMGVESSLALLQRELSRDLGVSCLLASKDIPAVSDIPEIDALLEKAKASSLSESARVDLLEALAKEETRLQELDAFPEITPRFAYQHTNDGGDFFGAGVTIPLAIWNRNQGERMKAQGAQAAVQARRQYLLDGGFEYQIRALRNAAVRSKTQADTFARKVVPAYQTALSAQERLYSAGKGNLMEIWQIFKSTNEAQLQSAKLLLESMKARVELSLLVGEEM